MNIGIQYQPELDPSAIREVGFSCLELPVGQVVEQQELPVSGIVMRLAQANPETLYVALVCAKNKQAHYLLLDTTECTTEQVLLDLMEECAMMIADFGVEIYLENGFVGNDAAGYRYTVYSDVRKLKEMAEYGNRVCAEPLFGIAINIGYANLLEQNIRTMVGWAGEYLKLVHVNDNDGIHNVRQMPYTFTKGRGSQTTDWFHIIGEMMRISFDGWLIFDTTGLFCRTPEVLRKQMLKILYAIAMDWEAQYHFEDILNQPDKKLILFGAGAMSQSYMEAWGEKYPPVFMVDNNPDVWDTERDGMPIRKPEAILDVPVEERNVLICNSYYDQIKAQLYQMGVEFHCYWDHYYL